MYSRRIAALLVIGSVGGIVACEHDPAVSTDLEDADSFAALIADDDTGPFLLEMVGEPEPALLGCAQAVNNEGMISGWHVIDIGGGGTVELVAVWNRNGEFSRSASAGYDIGTIHVLGMSDRGHILSRVGTGGIPELRIDNPDGSLLVMPDYALRGPIDAFPIRMNRVGAVMVTYWLNSDCEYMGYCPQEDILTTHLGWLVPPAKPPSKYWIGGWCFQGEAIDDNGAVYGQCLVEGKVRHYRWTAQDNAKPFPTGVDRLLDVGIHDINRYGELVGRTIAGPIFWSAATGRVQIPIPPGVSQLRPVAINDRGEVLLSSDYVEGENRPAGTIAYWTRSGGTNVLPSNEWPHVEVHDINNQGVIVGCVASAGGQDLVPAYWRIR